MKIQKLLYLAHGFWLVDADAPLVNEMFEAWKFGPVLPSLYHECKGFGRGAITNYLQDVDPDTFKVTPAPIPAEQAINELVDFVWENYGDIPAMRLSDWTHVQGGPWDKVTKGGTEIIRHRDVPNEMIGEYFRQHMYASS